MARSPSDVSVLIVRWQSSTYQDIQDRRKWGCIDLFGIINIISPRIGNSNNSALRLLFVPLIFFRSSADTAYARTEGKLKAYAFAVAQVKYY